MPPRRSFRCRRFMPFICRDRVFSGPRTHGPTGPRLAGSPVLWEGRVTLQSRPATSDQRRARRAEREVLVGQRSNSDDSDVCGLGPLLAWRFVELDALILIERPVAA